MNQDVMHVDWRTHCSSAGLSSPAKLTTHLHTILTASSNQGKAAATQCIRIIRPSMHSPWLGSLTVPVASFLCSQQHEHRASCHRESGRMQFREMYACSLVAQTRDPLDSPVAVRLGQWACTVRGLVRGMSLSRKGDLHSRLASVGSIGGCCKWFYS